MKIFRSYPANRVRGKFREVHCASWRYGKRCRAIFMKVSADCVVGRLKEKNSQNVRIT